MRFKIETDMPLPQNTGLTRALIDALSALMPGQSFVVPTRSTTNNAFMLAKKHGLCRITSRKVENGFRIWCTKKLAPVGLGDRDNRLNRSEKATKKISNADSVVKEEDPLQIRINSYLESIEGETFAQINKSDVSEAEKRLRKMLIAAHDADNELRCEELYDDLVKLKVAEFTEGESLEETNLVV